VSVVQAHPSSQFIGGPLWQTPALHASPTVQEFPSEQGPVMSVWPQASVPGSQISAVQGLESSHTLTCAQDVPVQESTVHGSPSLQFSGVPLWQAPLLHTSPAVHGFPSLQDAVLLLCAQDVPVQESVVQALPSSQFSGVPLRQAPLLQTSPAVHGFPSLQGLVLAERVTQPFSLHSSLVQILPSHSPGPCWT